MHPATPQRPVRVMVVDDSDATRAALVQILRSAPDVEVVHSTGDADDGLRRVLQGAADVVCLDLEMPRMDGFTFLRLLMARRPTPVIVISSNSRKQDVFKALEFGALDFVAKPEKSGDLGPIRQELLAKIATVRSLRIENLEPRAPAPAPSAPVPPRPAAAATAAATPVRPPPAPPAPPPPRAPEPHPAPAIPAAHVPPEPRRVVVIGASTGGPSAIARLLGLLPHDLPAAIAIAQHMPERFTRAFAERLDRGTHFDVHEAEDGDALAPGRVLVAPGGKHLKVVRAGSTLRAIVIEPKANDGWYRPSVDLLFQSAAQACGASLCGVVLTGMGSDGRAGIGHVKAAGGLTLAESERTAVVYGMPKEAVESGQVDEVLPLEGIVERLVEFAAAP